MTGVYLMSPEQAASVVQHLRESLARGAGSVLLLTTDDPMVAEKMGQFSGAGVPPLTSELPNPDFIYHGQIYVLALAVSIEELESRVERPDVH